MTKKELYEKARMLPLLPGVYIIRNNKDEIIYIGKAKRLRTRVSQYFREGVPHDAKVTRMIESAYNFDVIVTQSEFEALVLECSQIKQHTPKYNILLKDDKGYSYVKITKEPYPRITAELQKSDDTVAEYIGPFTSSYAVHEMVETAVQCFKLPTCNKKFPQDFKKSRPCLNAHIGRCMAVCTGKISQNEYAECVEGAVRLIKHGKGEIVKMLTEKMTEASDNLEFERAAILRDQINAIEKVSAGQKVVACKVPSQDVIAFAAGAGAVCAAVLRFRNGRLVDKREFVFHDTCDIETVREEFFARYYSEQLTEKQPYETIPRTVATDELPQDSEMLVQMLGEARGTTVNFYIPQRGDNQKLVQMAYLNAMDRLARENGRYSKQERVLEEFAGLLGMQKSPEIIESYDISNWGDGTSVAGMIVFQNGKPYKSGYRRFKINSVEGVDDYASMAETLSRRVAEYQKGAGGQFGIKPDLILLDGGKGQLSVVREALKGTAFGDVPLFGMVKDDKHRTRAIVSDSGEIAINMNKSVFSFVTSVQDEVHRFSIEYQRQRQKKKSYSSSLTKISGIGDKTAKLLISHFKTVTAVSEADINELCKVKGISEKTAQTIYNYYHGQ